MHQTKQPKGTAHASLNANTAPTSLAELLCRPYLDLGSAWQCDSGLHLAHSIRFFPKKTLASISQIKKVSLCIVPSGFQIQNALLGHVRTLQVQNEEAWVGG